MSSALGERIKSTREDASIKRSELAKLVDMPYSTLAELEQGKSASTSKLARLAAVLKVDPLWLEAGRGQKSPRSKVQPSLADVSPLTKDENRLLALFRTVNPAAQSAIIRHAREIAALTRSTVDKRL